MPQNDMAGSITYGQQKYLKRLVDEREEYDAQWFNDLKEKRIDYEELSAAEASQYIEALKPDDVERDDSSQAKSDEPKEPKQPPGPATEKQLDLLKKMMSEKELVDEEGFVDTDHLYSLLTTSTASKLIDAVRYIPRSEAA